MKKLLLVLMVVAMASFLFVGCLTVPDGPGDEDEDENGEVDELCPTATVSDSVAIDGKTYIKAGSHTITVEFEVPTVPVSVYVGLPCNEKTLPVGVPDDSAEVVMYTTDNLTYTGTYTFSGDCCEGYIYVLTCETCAPCKYPYIVDGVGPYATIEVSVDKCTCPPGCELLFESTTTTDCVDVVNCGDACSGFYSWSINLYDDDPFDDCCLVPCEVPIDSDSGVCPISFTTDCILDAEEPTYVVVTLADEVGNETKYFAIVDFNPDTCDTIEVVQYAENDEGCSDWQDETGDNIIVG